MTLTLFHQLESADQGDLVCPCLLNTNGPMAFGIRELHGQKLQATWPSKIVVEDQEEYVRVCQVGICNFYGDGSREEGI